MGRPRELFLTGDIARATDRSTSMVRLWINEGRLRPVAITPTGVRLFEPRDVRALVRQRENDA